MLKGRVPLPVVLVRALNRGKPLGREISVNCMSQKDAGRLRITSGSQRRFQDRFVNPTKWFRAHIGSVVLISSCKWCLIEVPSQPEAVSRLVELRLRGKPK